MEFLNWATENDGIAFMLGIFGLCFLGMMLEGSCNMVRAMRSRPHYIPRPKKTK